MKNKNLKFYFFLFFFFSLNNVYSFVIENSTSTNRVEFKSEYAMYSDSFSFVTLSTNVVVYHISSEDKLLKTIKTEYLEINLSSSQIKMSKPFIIEDSSGIIKANKGIYDYKNSKGEIYDGTVFMNRFIFRGKVIDIDKKKYTYKKAYVTTCDLEEPHYRIAATRIYLLPGKYFVAYNTFFYLGKIPVFYFPLIYKPLGEGTPVISQFYPGYDERNGFYVKSNYVYKFDKYTKLKMFLDYFSKKGWGTGLEMDYFKPEENKISISAYRIREYGMDKDRWGANGGTWLSLKKYQMTSSDNFYFQTYFRLLSDPEFNNSFFRSNPFAISSDKQASVGFTYKTAKTVTRLSSYVLYTSTNNNSSFTKTYQSMPKLDFQTIPIKFGKIPFFNTYSFSFENSMENTSYYQKKGDFSWNISKPVGIYKSISFYPNIFYRQNVKFSTSSNTSDIWVGRYGVDLNLRYSFSKADLDLQYYTLIRNEVNKLKKDKDSIDKGIEERYVSGSLFFIKNSSHYTRFYTKYDLKEYPYQKDFIERFYPFNVEFYRKIDRFELYVQDSYSLREGNKYFVAQINTGNDKEYFNMGLANYSENRKRYIFTNGIGFVPPLTKSWRAELNLKYSIDFSGKPVDFNFFDKEVILYKDFHDFKTRFNLRVRRGVKEFFVYLTLKMNDRYRRDEIDRQADEFWRPWRKEGDFRD